MFYTELSEQHKKRAAAQWTTGVAGFAWTAQAAQLLSSWVAPTAQRHISNISIIVLR